MTIRVEKVLPITLDGTGGGTASVGPEKYGQVWSLTRFATKGSSATEPQLNVYRGTVGSSLVDTTRRGNSAVSENNELRLLAGEILTVEYVGGTAGAVMTFYLEGSISYGIPG